MGSFNRIPVLLSILFSSCAFKPSSYLFPTEEKMVFTWQFETYGSGKMLSGTYNVFFQSFSLNEVNIYYVVNENSLGSSAWIDSDYFLNSAMIFRNDSILLAPYRTFDDIKQLQITDFKFIIPKHINSNDTIRIVNGEKSILLFGFNKANLDLNKLSLKKCLNIKVLEKWEKGNLEIGRA